MAIPPSKKSSPNRPTIAKSTIPSSGMVMLDIILGMASRIICRFIIAFLGADAWPLLLVGRTRGLLGDFEGRTTFISALE